MQVTCSCGKKLNVPDTLAGKNARCPACNKVFKVEGVAAPAAPPGKVAFACACGRKLTAPVTAAGKKVACPACNKDLIIPGAVPAAPATPPAAPKPAAAPAKEEEDEGAGMYEVTKPHCPNCKAELEVNAQFCIQCGTTLSTGTKVQNVEAQQQKVEAAAMSPKVKMIFMVAGGVLLVAAGLTTWLVLSRGKSKTPQTTTTTAVSRTGTTQAVGITDYVPFLVRQPKAIQIKMDLLGVQQSVQAYQAQAGRFPKSLQELEGAGYPLPPLPKGEQYDYNPNTGEVTAWQAPAEEVK